MAGTVVVTEIRHGSMKKIHFAWTSDPSGDADEVTSFPYNGKIENLTTIPSGAAAPTADYDITLTDSDGVDVLAGAGVDRSATAQENVVSASLGAVVESALTLTVAAAGNAKSGDVYVFIR